MLFVTALVDHKYVLPADDVKVTLPPEQKVVGPPADIVGADGNIFTVILVAEDAGLWQPFASVT
jgi:hypothetical protein